MRSTSMRQARQLGTGRCAGVWIPLELPLTTPPLCCSHALEPSFPDGGVLCQMRLQLQCIVQKTSLSGNMVSQLLEIHVVNRAVYVMLWRRSL